MGELDQLRAEISEVRDLAEATLMTIVGRKKVGMYAMEANIENAIRREKLGTPLHTLFGGRVLDQLTWKSGFGVRTVEELVAQRSREDFAALPGVGPSRLANLEAVMAERGLTWAEAA